MFDQSWPSGGPIIDHFEYTLTSLDLIIRGADLEKQPEWNAVLQRISDSDGTNSILVGRDLEQAQRVIVLIGNCSFAVVTIV